MLPADELWMVDLRHFEFKSLEQKRRKATRLRWRGMVASMVGIAAVFGHAGRSSFFEENSTGRDC